MDAEEYRLLQHAAFHGHGGTTEFEVFVVKRECGVAIRCADCATDIIVSVTAFVDGYLSADRGDGHIFWSISSSPYGKVGALHNSSEGGDYDNVHIGNFGSRFFSLSQTLCQNGDIWNFVDGCGSGMCSGVNGFDSSKPMGGGECVSGDAQYSAAAGVGTAPSIVGKVAGLSRMTGGITDAVGTCTTIVGRIVPIGRVFLVGLLLTVGHQMALSAGLQQFVLSSEPRTTLVEMNKEGLVSWPGYLALTLLSIGLGRDFFTAPRNLIWKLLVLGILYGGSVAGNIMQPSRRLANLPFVVGAVLMTALQTCAYRWLVQRVSVPSLLSGISRNQLVFFLAGNLLTGAVNMAMYTLLQSYWTTVSVLIGYMAILCTMSTMLHRLDVSIKL
ncbi:hypothetical protein PSACC_03436 [Paramicrosporidium saccamoebae]|uniref:GPI-anchored wall transfer protein 1 n=1 Tax=Paramicrosporidium saccamoebae TaxID=1246581 RepID=A0A2H9TGM8_9FUNG|nr:hypothetical protein PSACC_03436 [Paramicrosporidium saccamoebae]